MKSAIFLIGLITVSNTLARPSPNPADPEDDDRYTPLIRLLKELRRRDHDQQDRLRDNMTTGDASAVGSSDQNKEEAVPKIYNSNSFSTPDQLKKILDQSDILGSTTTVVPDVSSLPNFNLPSNKQQSESVSSIIPLAPAAPSGTTGPISSDRVEQINRGVSTILGGVRNASLDEILRGSFMFTRNENVRSIANNVLDAIFGRRNPPPQTDELKQNK